MTEDRQTKFPAIEELLDKHGHPHEWVGNFSLQTASGKEANRQEQVMQEAQNNSNEQAATPVPGIDHPTEAIQGQEKEQEAAGRSLQKRYGRSPSEIQGFPSIAHALHYVASWLPVGEEVAIRSILETLYPNMGQPGERPNMTAVARELIETGEIPAGVMDESVGAILFPSRFTNAEAVNGLRPAPEVTLRFFSQTDLGKAVVDVQLNIVGDAEELRLISSTIRDPSVGLFTRLLMGPGAVVTIPVAHFMPMLASKLQNGEVLQEIYDYVQAVRDAVESAGANPENVVVQLRPTVSVLAQKEAQEMAWNANGIRALVGYGVVPEQGSLFGKPSDESPHLDLHFNISGDSSRFEVEKLVYIRSKSSAHNIPGILSGETPASHRRAHMRPWRSNHGAAWSASPAERLAQQSGEMFVGQRMTGAWGKMYGERGVRSQYEPHVTSFQGRPWYDLTEEQQAQRRHIKPRNVYMKTDSFEMLRLFIAGAQASGVAEQEELRLFESRLVDLDLKLRQFDRPVIYEAALNLDGSAIPEAIDPSAAILITAMSGDKQLMWFEGHLRG